MIDRGNIPSDRIGAEHALNGMKSSLVQLVEMMVNDNNLTVNQISGWAWNQIEEIDEILEG